MKKRVLIVASHFPPNPPGGVMRVAKLVKYLPEVGWDSIVLCSTVMQPALADQLVEDARKAQQVYRVPMVDIGKPYRLMKSLIRRKTPTVSTANGGTVAAQGVSSLSAKLLVPDFLVTWIPGAVMQGVQAIRRHDIDVIFSTSPFPSGLITGYWIHRITGKPWIVDLMDPWTTNCWAEKKAFPILDRLDSALERRVFAEANRITVIESAFIPPILDQHPELSPGKFELVTNGFDSKDFEKVDPYPFDRFTIVHTGTFYGRRSAEPFLRGLSTLFEQEPGFRSKVQAVMVGKLDDRGASFLYSSDIKDSVKVIDSVPYQISLRYLLGADILLLIPGPGDNIMTGKVYEYLAARKPIFVISDGGVARNLVVNSGAGIAVDVGDENKIAEKLGWMIEAIRSSSYPKKDITDFIQQFDRRNIAAKMAGIFNTVLTE